MKATTVKLLRAWLTRHARQAGTAAALAALSAGALAGPIAFNRHADTQAAQRVERPAACRPKVLRGAPQRPTSEVDASHHLRHRDRLG